MKEWLIASAVGLLAGAAGAMGLGGGTVLLLYLTLVAAVPQAQAQGINLIFFLPTALTATLANAKAGLLEKRSVVIFTLLGLAGAAAGLALLGNIGSGLLAKLFGGFLIIFGVKELFFVKGQKMRPKD